MFLEGGFAHVCSGLMCEFHNLTFTGRFYFLHIQVLESLSLLPPCAKCSERIVFPEPRIQTKVYEFQSITVTSRTTNSPYPSFHDRIFLHKWHLSKDA